MLMSELHEFEVTPNVVSATACTAKQSKIVKTEIEMDTTTKTRSGQSKKSILSERRLIFSTMKATEGVEGPEKLRHGVSI